MISSATISGRIHDGAGCVELLASPQWQVVGTLWVAALSIFGSFIGWCGLLEARLRMSVCVDWLCVWLAFCVFGGQINATTQAGTEPKSVFDGSFDNADWKMVEGDFVHFMAMNTGWQGLDVCLSFAHFAHFSVFEQFCGCLKFSFERSHWFGGSYHSHWVDVSYHWCRQAFFGPFVDLADGAIDLTWIMAGKNVKSFKILPLMLDTTKPPIDSPFFACVPCFPCRCRRAPRHCGSP
jgi:hypothetical protein